MTKNILTFLIVLLGAGAFYLFRKPSTASFEEPYPQEQEQAQDKRQEDLIAELGLRKGWKVYQPSQDPLLEAWQPSAVKIIYELQGGYFLADLKKASGKKNQRREFPGGRVDPGESVVAALIRELQEEDPSGTLVKVFSENLQDNQQTVHFKNIVLKKGDHQTLFRTSMTQQAWQQLKQYWRAPHASNKEIYGFVMLRADQLDTRLSRVKTTWTRKSRRILKALRKG